MGTIRSFLDHLDWLQMVFLLMSVTASLICITLHELAHGITAYRLGDPTAKINGRLTLNPIAHIDFFGLLLMITVHVGWAKPVPVDMRNFRRPKRDMAITALAGPVSNFILAIVSLGIASAVFHFVPDSQPAAYAILFFCYTAILSVGLGLFNLIPFPPLDGSKILFSLLPDPIYRKILQYERFMIAAVILLAWLDVFSRPLSAAMEWIVRGLCALTGLPFAIPKFYFF